MMNKYQTYKQLLTGIPFPFAVLDLDLFNKNIQINLERAGTKKIRIASKSLRCVKAMRLILEANPQFQGIMTYHGKEALFLAEQGFDDLLMGYPIVDAHLIEAIGEQLRKGRQICLMVDRLEHLSIINEVGKRLKTKMPVCIDLDLSDDYPGLRFGVWRSSISTTEELAKLLAHLKKMDYVQLDGLMGYEAQIAGVGDAVKGAAVKNRLIRWLKKRSIRRVAARRGEAVNLIESEGFKLRFVNGGGTGSLESTAREAVVSEVTVGSGFYNAHLFDNYRQYDLHPAFFYAIPIVRKPSAEIYTCHGGGFIASGSIEKIKAPIVHLPKGGSLDTLEGAGEVQTPLRFTQLEMPLNIGDPVFMRHAKSGELCERFKQIVVIEQGELSYVNTYRGDQQSFG